MLTYTVTTPLDIPEDAFNKDDIATLVVTGGSYGGAWVLNVCTTHVPKEESTMIGSFETEAAPRQPDLAIEAAKQWLSEECERLGVKLARFDSMNSHYGPDEAPFFASAAFYVDRRK